MAEPVETPGFSRAFRDDLVRLMAWRRDIRRFHRDPVDQTVLDACLATMALAPSVGLSEPWRIVRLSSQHARDRALKNFQAANADALKGYSGKDARIYSELKLSGMVDAPVQLAIFCDDGTRKGRNLGTNTMPEMRRYSVVCAIQQFWLAARANDIGVGWVSIIDPVQLATDLDVPQDWTLIAYLCVGHSQEVSDIPELARAGWETRAGAPECVIR
ncbi:5,6-dimethylbenzimidazole synthase [Sedimentitalea nanhaiensis]|uniref:Cob(II)yrinic acid a,c-diamide reductase /5,6-dimethylbenzimidazole synthase n=1 Tax=Sedimentitalea nanhaiensis TaxID=999627 RepID=A0A1I6X502_9RHOB|nr:5,6-dimethylbenzimidazole synthase [Sedimentitalea nanhaiensis]SFT32971.1 cob(II)yrinic acid a,c-diamide reductase /5,6-dimethylbenzimidazole synthase [Sedimentitalea nanhaiensis]